METNKKNGLGVASFVLGIIGVVLSCVYIGIIPCLIGLILGIIALSNSNLKHGIDIAGIALSAIGIMVFAILMSVGSDESSNDVSDDTTEIVEEYSGGAEIETEKTSDVKSTIKKKTDVQETEKESETEDEIETEEVAVADDVAVADEVELFKESCQEFDYKTIARNPDDYVGQNFKVTVEISSTVSPSWYDDYNCYYKAWTDDGSGWYYDHMIYIMDYQDKDSDEYLKILDDDIVVVYGTFNGMVDTKNYLSGENGEEIGLDIYYAELISE